MSRRAGRGRGRRQQPPVPAFSVPKGMDKKRVQKIINEEAAKAVADAPSRPFRFRRQLLPLLWLAALPAALVLRQEKAAVLLWIASLLIPLIAVGASRGKGTFTRGHVQGEGAWAGLWMAVSYLAGTGWWTAVWLAGWAVPYGFWLHRYRWRPAPPEDPQEEPPDNVIDIFRELAEKRKWSAVLAPAILLPGGGRSWPVICKGAHTHIGQIAAEKSFIAAAYDRPVTEAYVEPDVHGVKSRGMLVLLKAGTLDEPVPWDGAVIDAEGLGRIGRFPDGAPVRQRWYVPGVGGGARHTIVAGADGTGKTGTMDIDLAMSCRSGLICPVILDPQEGQALPAWQDTVPYARGADESMVFLRGLHAAMFARSAYLGQLVWTDPRTQRRRKGMGFFDAHMTGLPFIEVVIDEAPVLLAIKGALQLVLDIGKLGRKTGFRLLLAAQQPSIKELGDSALRAMLVGGNVFCFRTADKVTKGMVNIPADPEELPKYFRNGRPTVGLGYADTIDNRQWTNMRTDWAADPYELAETCQPRPLDDMTAGCIADSLAARREDAEAASSASAEEHDRCTQVLRLIDRPMSLGEVLVAVQEATTMKVSEIVSVMETLEADGAVRRTGDLIEVAP